jgi:hypothetical protein
MPLEITLRTDRHNSPFRGQLLKLCRMPMCDRLILCSGYIQEPPGPYSISNDRLLSEICGNGAIADIELYAGMLYNRKAYGQYLNFVNSFRSLYKGTLQAYVAVPRKWHAKMAFAIGKGRPLAAIIGSSNLTRPAYGVGFSRWNYESDVTIWLNEPAVDSYWSAPAQLDGSYSIQASLRPGINQPDEESRMRAALKLIEDNRSAFTQV